MPILYNHKFYYFETPIQKKELSINYIYLAIMWTIELSIRHCDICKEFRLEIPVMQKSQVQDIEKGRAK